MNPYWNLWTIFPHESLLNLWASKASQNWTWILPEFRRQFFRMYPYWICAHLKLVKVGHRTLLKFAHSFPHISLLNSSSKMLHGEVTKIEHPTHVKNSIMRSRQNEASNTRKKCCAAKSKLNRCEFINSFTFTTFKWPSRSESEIQQIHSQSDSQIHSHSFKKLSLEFGRFCA